MAKKEAKTDLWVYELLREANIELEPQGSTVLEIDKALKSASKSKTGNIGFPEYVGVVKDFIIVIENKADVAKHVKRKSKDVISVDVVIGVQLHTAKARYKQHDNINKYQNIFTNIHYQY